MYYDLLLFTEWLRLCRRPLLPLLLFAARCLLFAVPGKSAMSVQIIRTLRSKLLRFGLAVQDIIHVELAYVARRAGRHHNPTVP